MSLEIRRIIEWSQTTCRDGGRDVTPPTKLFAAIAIIKNPWFGRGFVEDLSPEIKAYCPFRRAVNKLPSFALWWHNRRCWQSLCRWYGR